MLDWSWWRLPPYGFTDSEFVSVADLAWPESAALNLRQLAGWAERDPYWDVLEPGRLPLYACPECADVYCGALTVAVRRGVDPVHGREVVCWEQLRCEDAQTPAEQMPDLSPVGSFTFDAAQYDATLRAALERMEKLARIEDQAEAAWKARRKLRVRLRRFLRSAASGRLVLLTARRPWSITAPWPPTTPRCTAAPRLGRAHPR